MKRNFFAGSGYGLIANGMIAVLLAGCASGGRNITGPTQPSSAALTIAPTTGTLRGGATQSFTVSGNGSSTVMWSVAGVPGGNTTVGTISAGGLYTAPTFPPAPNSVTITASETADAGKTANASFTLQNPVPQITSISPVSIPVGTFTLAVAGSQFATGAVVQWNGAALPTTYMSSTQLTATGTATSSQVGTVPVTVDNPDPGSILSAAVNVQITAVSPQSTTATAAARFLDQSSFGPTAATIAHVQQIGLKAALTEQFTQPTTLFSEPPSPDTAVCGFTNWHCTQSEFVNVSTWGNDQLRQRVAMALSEIFVAPIAKDNAMPLYLNTLANDAFTNYRQIMHDVATSPDMGYYLNMLNSGKPAAGQIANENFGRENMQLFTLGLALLNPDGTIQTDSSGNPIPTYTELQVEAFARAYTGWTYANADGSTPKKFNSTQNWLHPMVAVASEHDTTAKILLNGTTLSAGQSAEDDLKGALDNIFAHPNIGPFVCRQLIQHLVSGDPSPAYVSRVAAIFADNGGGVRGDMKAVLTAILLDPEARAGDAQTGDQANSSPTVDGGHLREPLLYSINLLRGLNAAPPDPTVPYPYVSFMSQAMSAVGEAPFNQASVFNYFPPEYVIPQTSANAPEFALENTGSVVPRLSLADHIIHNKASGPTIDLSATSAIGQRATDAGQLVDYVGMIFMHSQMSTPMRTAIVQAVSAIPATDLQGRAQVAVFLVVTSSQYKILH